MKKPNKKNTVNLFFSAFLILAFVVCAHFFSNFALGQNQVLSNVIQLFVYTVFGLLLFNATRVGDGKPVKRFSPITLISPLANSFFTVEYCKIGFDKVTIGSPSCNSATFV